MLTGADALTLAAASRATTTRVCTPSATRDVSQASVYGAAVRSAPTGAPSTLNCTPAMPTSSLAPALSVMVLATVAPAAGAVIDTEGAVVSGAGPREYVMCRTGRR